MFDDVKENYDQCLTMMYSLFSEVHGHTFYSELFPSCERSDEFHSDYSHPNAIYYYQDISGDLRRRVMYSDTFDDDYFGYIHDNPMTLCSGLTYFGCANKLKNARDMHALIFDIDGVSVPNLRNLFQRCWLEFDPDDLFSAALPLPTYVVLSGTGIHLYYVFKEPIALYPNIKLQLKELKYALTNMLWHYHGTSEVKSVQYQSISQNFRMVGSINSKYGLKVVAFDTGNKIDLEYLNQFVSEKYRVDVNQRFTSHYSLSEAQINFPEWYEKVIVRRDKQKGKWLIKEDLYKWWLRKTLEAKGGHRYYTLLACVIYADKCCIPFERVKKDLQNVFNRLKNVDHINELTQSDVEAALEVYGTGCHTTPISYIERITAIRIDRNNRRNYRKRDVHLKLARMHRDMFQREKNAKWDDNNGRKPKKDIVQAWRKDNPQGRKIDCHRDTKLSRPTIDKWWNEVS